MVARLMAEGGIAMHTLFFTACLVDELHVAVAPLLADHSRTGPASLLPRISPSGRRTGRRRARGSTGSTSGAGYQLLSSKPEVSR